MTTHTTSIHIQHHHWLELPRSTQEFLKNHHRVRDHHNGGVIIYPRYETEVDRIKAVLKGEAP